MIKGNKGKGKSVSPAVENMGVETTQEELITLGDDVQEKESESKEMEDEEINQFLEEENKVNDKDYISDGRKIYADIYGFKIYSGTIYVITGKPDESAPSGYVDRGISKSPFPGNMDVVQCKFSQEVGVFDTGFYTQSACFNGYGEEEASYEVKRRTENIRKPYELKTMKVLTQDNLEFWDNTLIKLYEGRVFIADNIQDRFELYIAILSHNLTPKDMDGDPDFRNSYFCVVDQKTSTNVERMRKNEKFDAIRLFGNMIEGTPIQREKLLDISLYMDIVTRTDMEENSMYTYQFQDWLDREAANAGKFLENIKRFSTAENKDIPKLHRMIRFLMGKGKVQVTTEGVTFDGYNIGNDTRGAAIRLAQNPNRAEVKGKLIQAYNIGIGKEKNYLDE